MVQKTAKSQKKDAPQYIEEIKDNSSLIASYFGFQTIKKPVIERKDTQKYKNAVKDSKFLKEGLFDLRERVSLLRSFEEWEFNKLPPPIALTWKRPLAEEGSRKSGDDIALDIFGLSESCAEAIILRSVISILEEAQFENLLIELNCFGAKDSLSEFEKNLNNYIRKNINAMPASVRKAVKKNIYSIYDGGSKEAEELAEQAPKSLSFLGEDSRKHFKDVLEYVESFGIPYILNHRLVGVPGITTKTVFQIRDESTKSSPIIAQGMRYSKLAKKVGFKKELPVVGATVNWKKSYNKDKTRKSLPKVKFFLVQLGFEAKIKALNVIEALRRSKISVAHSVSKDKLSSQLSQAENMRIPYVLIMGHKEALEGIVVVRDMNTRVQEAVPAHELAEYLKKLK